MTIRDVSKGFTQPGLSTLAVEVIISETGLDMNCWKNEKHFCSWLKICPDNRISRGKLLRSRPRKAKNRAAAMLRRLSKSSESFTIDDFDKREKEILEGLESTMKGPFERGGTGATRGLLIRSK